MLKLSFILPCYNVAPYIGRCIESIEHQDIPQSEYEVICVDDCSQDNTAEVIREYQKQYPNIRLICHTENKTAGGARNTGMDAARGEYLWFVDPDDSIQTNVLGKLVKKSEVQDLDILLFNNIHTSESGDESICGIHQTKDEIQTGIDYALTQCAPRYLYDMASHTCCLYKRAFLVKNQIRYPVIRSSQDVVFVWKAELLAKRVSAVSDSCYHVYRRPESTTGSRGKLRANALIAGSLLYANEVNGLRSLSDNAVIEENLKHEIGLALNDDSRNVLRMTQKEQGLFYQEVQNYAPLVVRYQEFMNRKTKVIFNYRLPYPIWQAMMWMYMMKELMKG
ncbi:MAG: glycosyltransferase family 2 protein [Paludibacteraceae bacterium]|nr:glycosyltransferase family 2 protein [Paludibacteraceae bacterium]